MNTATMTLTPSTIPDLFGVTEVEEGPAETCTAETLSAAEATRAVLEAAAADEERASQAEELEGLWRLAGEEATRNPTAPRRSSAGNPSRCAERRETQYHQPPPRSRRRRRSARAPPLPSPRPSG